MRHMYLAIILLIGCGYAFSDKQKLNPRQIKAISVSQVFPLLNDKGKLIQLDTGNVKIYYYEKIRLYNLSYRFDSLGEDGEKVVLSETRHHFFIYHSDSSYGYSYDSRFTPSIQRVAVDSVFQGEWIVMTKLYPIYTDNITELMTMKRNPDSDTIYESYLLKHKDTGKEYGTFFLGYVKKDSTIPYSLCKELDSIKQMRLFKIQVKYYREYLDAYKITVDSREWSYDVTDHSLSEAERKKITAYFVQYINNSH